MAYVNAHIMLQAVQPVFEDIYGGCVYYMRSERDPGIDNSLAEEMLTQLESKSLFTVSWIRDQGPQCNCKCCHK